MIVDGKNVKDWELDPEVRRKLIMKRGHEFLAEQAARHRRKAVCYAMLSVVFALLAILAVIIKSFFLEPR